MQHAQQMRGSQRVRDPYADLPDPALTGPRILGQPPRQRAAGAKFHNKEGPVIAEQPGVVHGDNAWVA
jgi:hypothetical protein